MPDAALHVFYGRDNWDRTARLTGDARMLEKSAEWARRLKELAPLGVHDRGMVPGPELAREMLGAGVLLFPTWAWAGPGAGETSCISAMMAQAAGLRIVTSPIAALASVT